MTRWESTDGSYIEMSVSGPAMTMSWKHPTDSVERRTTYRLADERSAAELVVILGRGIPEGYVEVGE